MQELSLKNFIMLCILLLCFFTALSTDVYADASREEYRRIQKDIRTRQKKLESIKKKEQSVLDELVKTISEFNKIKDKLSVQHAKIKKLQNDISALQEDIVKTKESLQQQENLLRKRLKTLQKVNKESDSLFVLLTGEDISRTARLMRYINDISAYDYRLIERYKETLSALTGKEEEFQRVFAELKAGEIELTRLNRSLKDKQKEKQVLLANVRKDRESYEKMIGEMKEASSRMLKIIQESERREAEIKKKREAKTGKKEEPLGDSDFARLKGRLSWPVNGAVALHYGAQVDPLFNLPVFRSGIHIKTAGGSSVKAVHEGKVVFADDFKGYGQLVIISHGEGYHTLYGNLAKIFSKNGGIIKEYEIIGEVGESNALGASGLYFEIRYKGKPLDPQQWLKRQQ
ncbi:MAG: peptidoglycan DD-metalloendopeptidase family protein [Thermodesulfovibrionales bacterium]|nr:peptidoglycan DD-metalloendopeptidase family protein [Thermodesulfovibrionales bacterium]